MPSTKSGGARATERKRRAQKAARPKGYHASCIAAFKGARRRGNTAADALDEAVQTLRIAMRQAATDPGMPPEYCREQAARIAAAVAKAAEPRKLIDELADELRTAHEVMEALKVQDAAQEPPKNPGRAPSVPH